MFSQTSQQMYMAVVSAKLPHVCPVCVCFNTTYSALLFFLLLAANKGGSID